MELWSQDSRFNRGDPNITLMKYVRQLAFKISLNSIKSDETWRRDCGCKICLRTGKRKDETYFFSPFWIKDTMGLFTCLRLKGDLLEILLPLAVLWMILASQARNLTYFYRVTCVPVIFAFKAGIKIRKMLLIIYFWKSIYCNIMPPDNRICYSSWSRKCSSSNIISHA